MKNREKANDEQKDLTQNIKMWPRHAPHANS